MRSATASAPAPHPPARPGVRRIRHGGMSRSTPRADRAPVSLRESEAFRAGSGHPADGDADATYARVAELPLWIDRCELVPLVRDTSSGFTKVSTVVRLTGGDHEGEGEDITWDQIDQIEQLRRAGDLSWLRGRRTLDEFSTLLGLADLFPVEPI